MRVRGEKDHSGTRGEEGFDERGGEWKVRYVGGKWGEAANGGWEEGLGTKR